MYHIFFSLNFKAKGLSLRLRPGKSREMATSGVFSTLPKFFKIILDPLADTLRIPAEFRRRYGQNLPNPVNLKVPSGSVFEVELILSNGEILLQKGWKEFKERHSIGFGHLLVFEYDRNTQFDVLIFDTSASEINYPLDADFEADQERKIEDDGTDSDDSVVLLEQFPTSNRGKGKAKNLEDSGKADDVSIEILDDPPARQLNRRKRQHCDDTIGFPVAEDYSNGIGRQCPDGVRKQRALAKETCIAYQNAIAFTSAHTFHNPYFISLMQPSYVSSGFRLSVPLIFAKENLPCRKTDLTIQLKNGKAWSVRCSIAEVNAKLTSGWKDFVKDNALKVGDACIFEVAKSTKDSVWNVLIFRS